MLSWTTATANASALGAVAVSAALQLVAIHVPPVALALSVSPLDATEWLVVLACAACPAVVGQALRLFRPSLAGGRR